MPPALTRPLSALAAVALSATLLAAPADAAPSPPVPCPVASVPPLPGARPVPAAPEPPPREVGAPVVGGETLATDGLLVPAGAKPLPTTINTRSWVLADLDTGEILAACAPHLRSQPASTQKLLTVLAALPKVDLAQTITVTDEDLKFEPGSSAVGLVKGGKYTLGTILLGLMLNSGNDAANVLARFGGGVRGVAGTVAAMNSEAKRLHALDTTAVTPSGLDAPGQFTSAYDLALIARADFALPAFAKATATRNAAMPAQPPRFKGFQIQNDNHLLTAYPGAIGGKTGFTDLARHTYMGAAERGGRRLLVTMVRGEARPVRQWQQGAALLDWGFALPRNAMPVGHLVSPGADRSDTPPKGAAAGAVLAPALSVSARPSGFADQIGLGLGIATGAFALLSVCWVTVRRRKARRRRREDEAPAWS